MEEDERITSARNRAFETNDGMALGKNLPNAMPTKASSVYRITGFNQLKDILATGYVRPKEGKLKGGHQNEVFWSKGSDKLYYYDSSRIVLEAPIQLVQNDQIGAIPLSDLCGIWQFNEETGAFENRVDFYQKVYDETHDDTHHQTK